MINENIDKILEKYYGIRDSNISILQDIQEEYGYLPYEVLLYVSEKRGVPLQELYGIATFYKQFSLIPKGKYQISICLGTVCYVKGANDVLLELESILGIKNGECTSDGKFSIDSARCLGCCSMAPVIMINNDVYKEVKPKQVKEILEKYK